MKTIWQGSISFGLVNIPIKLFAATEAHALGFTLLHDFCHTPLQYHRWCPHCKKEISWEHTVKGLKLSEKKFLVLTPEMIAKLRPEKTETLEIVEFIDADKLDALYLNHHYYVAPAKKNEMAYTLFVKALVALDKIAIGRFVMRDKEYTCALRPFENYLLLTTLHYTYEIRDIKDLQLPANVKVNAAELKLAQELISKLSVKSFDMSKFKDTFAQEIKALLKKPVRKKTKTTKTKPTAKRTTKKPTLAETLRQSIKNPHPVARA